MLIFSSKFKIKKKSEIKLLLKTSKVNKKEFFTLYFKPNYLENDRLGILVSRKVGNAIVRNKIKRIFREIFRKEILRNPPYYDVLIQIRPGIKITDKFKYEICFSEWIKRSKTN